MRGEVELLKLLLSLFAYLISDMIQDLSLFRYDDPVTNRHNLGFLIIELKK